MNFVLFHGSQGWILVALKFFQVSCHFSLIYIKFFKIPWYFQVFQVYPHFSRFSRSSGNPGFCYDWNPAYSLVEWPSSSTCSLLWLEILHSHCFCCHVVLLWLEILHSHWVTSLLLQKVAAFLLNPAFWLAEWPWKRRRPFFKVPQ